MTWTTNAAAVIRSMARDGGYWAPIVIVVICSERTDHGRNSLSLRSVGATEWRTRIPLDAPVVHTSSTPTRAQVKLQLIFIGR